MPSFSASIGARALYVRRLSMAIVIGFTLVAFIAPTWLSSVAQTVFSATIDAFGWLYLSATAMFIVFLVVIALGRTGKLRLSRDERAPDYGYWSWVAMLFSAGMGVGLVFWGVAEPMIHFVTPPHGELEPESAEAARMAMQVSVFHWGIHQWANYAIVALAIAWVRYRDDAPGLISTTFRSILGDRLTAKVSAWVDVPAVIATTFGVATTIGFGILQINGGLSAMANVPSNVLVQTIIVAVITVAFLASTLTGLDRGILQLSRWNMALATTLAVVVFALGPTVFLLNVGTQVTGDYIDGFVDLSLRTAPWIGSSWSGEWTVFYWAWGLSWAPFVGTFIARVSRGRTIREFVTGVMIVPAAVSLAWFTIFGGTALHSDVHQGTEIGAVVAEDPSMALYALFDALPWTPLLSVIALLLIITFLVTSADSAAFVLGMFTEGGALTPSLRARVSQGVLLAVLSVALLHSGGLDALRTTAITIALPFLLVLFGMAIGLWRSVASAQRLEDAQELKRRQRLTALLAAERSAEVETPPSTP